MLNICSEVWQSELSWKLNRGEDLKIIWILQEVKARCSDKDFSGFRFFNQAMQKSIMKEVVASVK